MEQSDKTSKSHFLSFRNNLTALLATYNTGNTVSNMRFFLSTLGLCKTITRGKLHYTNCDPIHDNILDLKDDSIEKVLVSEIKQIMLENYNYTTAQMKTFLIQYKGMNKTTTKRLTHLLSV